MQSRERILATLAHREPDRVPFDLGSGLLAALVATPVGWLLSAWLTVPAGALAGLLLAVLLRPRPSPPA